MERRQSLPAILESSAETDVTSGGIPGGVVLGGDALWSGTNKNRDVSTRPFARSFAHLFALLTHLLAQLRIAHFARVLSGAHSFACSLTHEFMGKSLIRSLETTWFCPIVHAGGGGENG